MRARTFIDEPDTVRDSIRMILRHFGEGLEARCVPHQAFKKAARILKCMAHLEEKRVTWSMGREWRERLKLAGLDPDSLEVVDEGRWDLCWEQLCETWTFRDDVARRQIALGVRAKEKAGVRVRAVAMGEKREKTAEAADKTPEKKDYFRGEIKKKIGGKRRP